jgi:tetratricopeptide (TPR) repeat protein
MRRSSFLAAAALILMAGCYYKDPIVLVQPTAQYKEAESLYLRGRFVEARSKFRAVMRSSQLADKKWALEARYFAARCDHLTGHLSEAVRGYNDLLRSPKYSRLEVRVRAARGDINLETGNYQGAAHDYARARMLLEKRGSNVKEVDREKLLFGEGMALWSLRRLKESDQIFDRYMADFPEGRFIKEARAHHTKFTGRPLVTKFYCLVGGLHRIEQHANALGHKVRAKGFTEVVVQKRPSASRFVYTVRVGAFDTRQEAHAQKRELVAAGFGPVEVRP